MPRTYSAVRVANSFLDHSFAEEVDLSSLKLNKLVFFAHGWNLALHARPLLDEEVEAAKFGPLVRSLFEEFRETGNRPIRRYAGPVAAPGLVPRAPIADNLTRALLARVWQVYGGFSALQLSTLANAAGTPWEHARRNGQPFLCNDDLAAYFRSKAKAAEPAAVLQAGPIEGSTTI